jgi:hypothetical protein
MESSFHKQVEASCNVHFEQRNSDLKNLKYEADSQIKALQKDIKRKEKSIAQMSESLRQKDKFFLDMKDQYNSSIDIQKELKLDQKRKVKYFILMNRMI